MNGPNCSLIAYIKQVDKIPSDHPTYLNIDVIIVFSMPMHSRSVKLVAYSLHPLSRQPHAERRLDLDDDPNLSRGVIFAIQCRCWIHRTQFRFTTGVRSTAASLAHFDKLFLLLFLLRKRFNFDY